MNIQDLSFPQQNALCRFCASFFTWPVEKSKLIFQAEGKPVFTQMIAIPILSHIHGALASCTQRGGSAFLMFYAQGQLNTLTHDVTMFKSVNEGLAGVMAGSLSAPFHTYWELMKVRIGQKVSWHVYRVALLPMIMRHSVFDGTFFFVNDVLSDKSSPVKFACAAATASFTNLIFDVWKTQRMHRFPRHTSLWRVISSLRLTSFASNYIVKGIDLSFNWYVVGLIKDAYFDV